MMKILTFCCSFSTLEGSVLSSIDNLKRRMRKVRMTSPAVADLENAISELKVIIASGLILSYFQVEPKILNLILKMHT